MTTRAVERSIERTGSADASGPWLLGAVWYALGVVAFAAIYVAAARLGLLWKSPNTAATPVWPPTGISVAVLILGGLRWWPGVALGAFIANTTSGVGAPFAAAIAAGNTAEAVCAAWCAARFCGGRAVLDRPTDVFKYAILSAGVSTAIAATAGALIDSLRLRDWTSVGETWLVWWLGDAVSAVTVAPLILVVARHRAPAMDRRRWLEAGAILVVIGAVAAFIFGGVTEGSSFNDPLSFMVVPLVLWASFRFGLHGTVLLGLLLSVLAIAGTLAGYGPFAVGSRTYSLLLLQAFLGTATLSGLIVAATEGQRRRVVRDLEASETEYRAIFELAGSGKALLEPTTGRFTRVNRKLCEITGFSPEDLVRRTYTALTHPEDRGWTVEAAGRMSRGEDYLAQARWERKDGAWIWVSVAATLVPRGLGRPPVAALIVQDITASKRSEAVLRESEERFRLLADSAPALIWINGPSGCEFVNRGYLEFLGVGLEEVLGDGWKRFIHPDDADEYAEAYQRAAARRAPFEAEFRFRRHDGEYRWMRSAGRPRMGVDDAELGYTGVTLDVTERRRAEESLRVRARQQQAVAHLGEVALRERDLQRVFEQATETVAQTLEVEYAKVLELLPGGDLVLLRAGVGWRPGLVGVATVNAGRDSQAGYTLECNAPVVVADLGRDGRFHGPPLLVEHGVVSGMSCVIRGGDGAPWGVLGTHSRRRVTFTRDDVSFLVAVANILGEAASRARGELALRRSEERYRAVVEGQAEMVCRFRTEGEILFVNEAYARSRGVAPEALQGADFWSFVHEQDRPAVGEMLERLRPDAPQVRIENRFETSQGPRWTLWTNRALAFDASGRATEVQSSGIDITDRKEAERALARRAREQAALYALTDRLHRASTPAAVYDAALDGIVEALGCDRASILLSDEQGVMKFVAWRGLSEPYRAAVEGHSPWKRGEADPRPLSIGDAQRDPSVPEALRPVLRDEGIGALGFIPLVTHDGLIGKFMVYYDGPHEMSSDETDLSMTIGRQLAFGVQRLRDEEERVRAERELARHRDHLETLVRERTAELESSRERVRFAERMAALGALSAGLGHDMGNLLLPIRVRLEALERAGLPEGEREHVEAIRTASTYLQRLANGLRLLAVDPWRRGPGPAAELREWWTDAAPVLKAALPSGIRFESEFPAAPLWVRMSKPGLTQAVFNLVQNAGEAMRSRGHGLVRVGAEVRGGSALLSVADDGPGMTPEVRARCMEPFFTTKTRGLSTGLGLSLVFALVGEAGGELRLESAPGRGTTFTLVLPLGAAVEPKIDADRLAVVQVKRPHLRAFIQRELRQLRYRVSDDAAATAAADLLVLDHAAHAAPVKPGGLVVALDALDGTGGSPSEPAVALIRRRLEEVAGRAGAPAAREGGPWPA